METPDPCNSGRDPLRDIRDDARSDARAEGRANPDAKSRADTHAEATDAAAAADVIPPDPADVEQFASDDHFGRPEEACLCFCLHCNRQFISDDMWFQPETKFGKVVGGFWLCPTPNCGGAGFQFDIFPVDPDHPANAGWHEDGEDDEWSEEDGDEVGGDEAGGESSSNESGGEPYDPNEPKYAALDDLEDDAIPYDDDDLAGEEWKTGLAPGESVGESVGESPQMIEAQRRFEEEQKRYEMPDERPRFRDTSNEPDPPAAMEDDLPF